MMIEELIQQKLRLIFNDDSIVFDKSRFAGGLTNYNYIMNIQGKDYVIRQPGGMTNLMIDRKIEKVNNQIASKLGLNSNCVYFDEVSGIKVSELIVSSENFALSNPASSVNLQAVSRLLKKIHTSSKLFPNVFDWNVELAKYERIVEELNGDFFYDYHDLKKKLVAFVDVRINGTISVPCHNDTVPENFIADDKGNAYLIDWEYSGMNDPAWDVAAYILETRIGSEAIDQLLADYYGALPTEEEVMNIKCYMLIQDLLWTVWALIRHYNGDDFLDYCYFRYERFRRNIQEVLSSKEPCLAEMVRN